MSMMNIIRQQLAALIFLCSIHYIAEKKPLHYYICIAIAFLFHKSAVLMVIMYPILRLKDDWFKNVFLQLGLLIVAIYLSFRQDYVLGYVEVPFMWFTGALGYDNYQLGILSNDALNDRSQFQTNTGFGIYLSLFKCIPIILLSKQMKQFYNSRFFNMLYSMWVIRILSDYAIGSSIVLNRPFVFFEDIKVAMIAFFTYYCLKSKAPELFERKNMTRKRAKKKRIVLFKQRDIKKRNLTLRLLGIAMIGVHVVIFIYILSNGEINTSAYTFFW